MPIILFDADSKNWEDQELFTNLISCNFTNAYCFGYFNNQISLIEIAANAGFNLAYQEESLSDYLTNNSEKQHSY